MPLCSPPWLWHLNDNTSHKRMTSHNPNFDEKENLVSQRRLRSTSPPILQVGLINILRLFGLKSYRNSKPMLGRKEFLTSNAMTIWLIFFSSVGQNTWTRSVNCFLPLFSITRRKTKGSGCRSRSSSKLLDNSKFKKSMPSCSAIVGPCWKIVPSGPSPLPALAATTPLVGM